MDLKYLADYPRPDLARKGFHSLDSEWGFEPDPKDAGISLGWHSKALFSKKINVPYCVESEASGIGDPNPPRVVWYARTFSPDLPRTPGRTLLHFGAVDYRATVWLNGKHLGDHCGGYTPFSFEVDDALEDDNRLVVRVEDTRDASLPRGKQTLLKKAFLIFYPTVTGIWQPVWLERVGEIYLESFQVMPGMDAGRLGLNCRLAGGKGRAKVKAVSTAPDSKEARVEVEIDKGEGTATALLTIDVGDICRWSPEEPNLYGLRITIECGSSRDEVESFFGVRKVEAREGKIWLNEELLYQRLILDQGYFPGGHYTPLEPDDFRRDVELIKELGFNGLRMHQKVEDPRFLFWCDYLGCLVWEEMPSAYRFTAMMREALEREWAEIIKRDINHPSIITWVPFNESWGVGLFLLPFDLRRSTREYVKQVFRSTKELDSTRLVVDNSGYDHTSITDIVDIHHYLQGAERCENLYKELANLYEFRHSLLRVLKGTMIGRSNQNPFAPGEEYRGQPVIISEYGGFGFYGAGKGASLIDNFRDYTELIRAQDHICGYCYTQFCDTYQEKNGLLDSNRRPKVPLEQIRQVNRRISS